MLGPMSERRYRIRTVQPGVRWTFLYAKTIEGARRAAARRAEEAAAIRGGAIPRARIEIETSDAPAIPGRYVRWEPVETVEAAR